jgi:hypothetical protein
MEWWQGLVGAMLVVAGLGALYGLHRVCLWLEARGLLYYWHKKPSSSAAACFVALQQALEPPTRHVQHVKEEKRHHSEEDGAGQGNAGENGADGLDTESEGSSMGQSPGGRGGVFDAPG